MLVDLNNNIKCIFIYNLTELKTVIGESQLTFLQFNTLYVYVPLNPPARTIISYTLHVIRYTFYIYICIYFEQVLLEDLTADKLPSHAFITTIDQLSITNCTFGTIERNAFPVNTIGNVTLTNVTVDRLEGEAFQHSSFITNLRMTGCRVREMETNAVMSAVQSIHIERSQ